MMLVRVHVYPWKGQEFTRPSGNILSIGHTIALVHVGYILGGLAIQALTVLPKVQNYYRQSN